MIQIAFPALAALLGLLAFALSSNPKISTLGLVTYGCGFFVVCQVAAHALFGLR